MTGDSDLLGGKIMLNLNIAREAAQKAAAIQIELCKVRMGGARATSPWVLMQNPDGVPKAAQPRHRLEAQREMLPNWEQVRPDYAGRLVTGWL